MQILRKGKAAEHLDGLAAFNKAKEAQAKAEEAKKAEARKKLEEAMKDAEETARNWALSSGEGNGVKPEMGQMVEVHYRLSADGTLFDTSIKSIAQEKGIYNPGREPYAPFISYGPQAR